MSDIFTLANNFGKSAYEHMKDGFKKVPDEEFDKRMEICKACEFFKENTGQCGKCGCFLKIKASWNSEKCPIDKW